MCDLIEFLKARLDEDEQAARAAAADGSEWRFSEGAIYPSDTMSHPGPLATHQHGDLNQAHGEHIARHDPARVLVDIEAKRRIIEQLRRYEGAIQQESSVARPGDPTPDTLYAARDALREAVRLLTLPYADHPDYDESWRP